MSANIRNRERKYNSSNNDRFLRVLTQPVQAWEKKWAPSTRSKHHQVHKWVKADRTIVFEDEDDDDEEEEDQTMTEVNKETPNIPIDQVQMVDSTTNITTKDSVTITTTLPAQALVSSSTTTTVSDNRQTHTPTLNDVPDVDFDQTMISPAHLIPKDDVMDIQQLPLDEHNHTTKISIDVDKGGSSNTETPSSSIPVASAPAMISSVIETELSPILQHEQDLQLHQHQPTEQRVTTMEDQLLDIPINTPDAVSSTNTPGLDTPCDTPSDTPMQRTINVVTYNNDLLANSPQQEDPIPVPENINDVNDTN